MVFYDSEYIPQYRAVVYSEASLIAAVEQRKHAHCPFLRFQLARPVKYEK
jgi:hypothetical protein